MTRLDDYMVFCELMEEAVATKGYEWFNEWSEINQELGYIVEVSEKEFLEMIEGESVLQPDGRRLLFTAVDYRAMVDQLKKDVRGR